MTSLSAPWGTNTQHKACEASLCLTQIFCFTCRDKRAGKLGSGFSFMLFQSSKFYKWSFSPSPRSVLFLHGHTEAQELKKKKHKDGGMLTGLIAFCWKTEKIFFLSLFLASGVWKILITLTPKSQLLISFTDLIKEKQMLTYWGIPQNFSPHGGRQKFNFLLFF